MKQSGINRAGWGSFPHVLLHEFLTKDSELTELQKGTLRILIIYGKMKIPVLVKTLQHSYPNYVAHKEWLISDLFEIKKKLRTFYSLHMDENFTKVELIYNMSSDGKHKMDSEKIINATIRKRTVENGEGWEREKRKKMKRGKETFGTSELEYYRRVT